MNMIEQRAASILLNAVDRCGPYPGEYAAISTALDHLHKASFIVEGGLSEQVEKTGVLERALNANREVFREPLTMQGFAYSRPHGYSGDFEIIERIYSEHVSRDPKLSRWDEFFHASPATQAVRNRGKVLSDLLERKRPSSILSVGAGPALDIAQSLRLNEFPRDIHLLDNDLNALQRAAENLQNLSVGRRLTYHHKNALRFRTNEKFDLIWSSGLFDYLNDKTAKLLIRRLFPMLAEGGMLVIGNFSSNNPSRSYMEIIGQWFLIHRDIEDLRSLCSDVQPDVASVSVFSDETGVNLFLCLSRTRELSRPDGSFAP
ncbi:class I SAM-dependent methyltransferase [Rhizobium sp. BR 314]|uniref:class I SAM-dependent methyltransferase n=1 Tax=Rhizobium sp. BR 314 TaxID=3040013 RepID=UPI0039BF7D0C